MAREVENDALSELKREFLGLLETHRKIIYKVAATYCRLSQDRDELAQEIMGQLWRAFPRYDRSRSFSTWIYRIALNVAISFVRIQSRWQMISLDQQKHDLPGEPERDLGLEEGVEELYRFIGQLDPLNRALLLLYLEERPYREIAEILGLTETNVATKINRLKLRMSGEMVLDKNGGGKI